LDNTSFLGLSEDGSMNAISRCVEEDDGFHVRGALVVAPEKAMKYFLEQLKRISVECGSHPVFVLTPWLCFVRQPCCDDAGHVTNFGDPDFLLSLLSDLTKLKFQIRKAVAPALMVDSLKLICGSGYSQENGGADHQRGLGGGPGPPEQTHLRQGSTQLDGENGQQQTSGRERRPASKPEANMELKQRERQPGTQRQEWGERRRRRRQTRRQQRRLQRQQRRRKQEVLPQPAVAGNAKVDCTRVPEE
jgi:hypothetical protein